MLRRVVAELNVDDVELPPSDTRDWRATRPWAMAGYAVLLTLWCWLVGIPKDPGGVFLWLWLGVAAWSPARARDFGRAWGAGVVGVVARAAN